MFRQKSLILFVVSTALLLDNMLFMVIVPIITSILNPDRIDQSQEASNGSTSLLNPEDENISIGILFASKAIVQLIGML